LSLELRRCSVVSPMPRAPGGDFRLPPGFKVPSVV
jgi:hypothetical protein